MVESSIDVATCTLNLFNSLLVDSSLLFHELDSLSELSETGIELDLVLVSDSGSCSNARHFTAEVVGVAKESVLLPLFKLFPGQGCHHWSLNRGSGVVCVRWCLELGSDLSHICLNLLIYNSRLALIQ